MADSRLTGAQRRVLVELESRWNEWVAFSKRDLPTLMALSRRSLADVEVDQGQIKAKITPDGSARIATG